MRKALMLAMGVAGLAASGTKSYSIDLHEPALLGTTALAAGEYRVDVVDQKAVVRNGKAHCEAPVKVENGDRRYGTTSVVFNNGDGKMHIQEIHIGGTRTKLVFGE